MGRWQRHEALAEPSRADSGERPKPLASEDARGTVTCRYIWQSTERTVVFPAEGSEDVAGALPSAPSGPLKEYEDKLKAIDLCAQGMERTEIAASIGRSANWVKRWWKQNPQLIPKPTVKHGPLVQNAPLLSFRDLELRRGFAKDLAEGDDGPSLLEELTSSLKWEAARRATRCPQTGELRVRFDSSGNSIAQPGRFVAGYEGGLPKLDLLLQRMAAAAGIRDPGARVFLNRYETGDATCPVHRHDFWTAMVSLGTGRVAIVEERPYLLRHGDLLVFGTQSHGAPAMPEVGDRRISVVVFFRPDADNMERRWLTLEDGRDDEEEEAKAASGRGPAAAGCLVDSNLCGCPGISLGLIARRRARAEKAVTIFTLGCGSLPEAAFFERVCRSGVSDLWDIRCSASSAPSRWEPQQLKRSCAVRTLRYHWTPLGRAEAGGIRKHLASEEGRDVLAKLVLAAAEGRSVAILGHSEDWSKCDRGAVASLLTSGDFGMVSVLHITASGLERHPEHRATPTLEGPCSTSARTNRFNRTRFDSASPLLDLV